MLLTAKGHENTRGERRRLMPVPASQVSYQPCGKRKSPGPMDRINQMPVGRYYVGLLFLPVLPCLAHI